MAGYLAARDVQFGNPVGAFLGARDNARKNALFEQQQAAAAEQQQFQNQNTLFQQNRLKEQDAIAAQTRQQAAEQDDETVLNAYAQQLAAAKTQEHFNFLADRIASTQAAQRQGWTRDKITPEIVTHLLSDTEAMVGQGPKAEPVEMEEVRGPRGSILQRDPTTGKLTQVVGPDNSQPAAGGSVPRFRTLSPAEVQAAGFPPGTVVQQGADGKLDVVTKRDNTGALNQKDSTTAKMKLNTVSLARQQLQKIREAFDEGRKGVNAFGGAQGWLPTQAGQKFDARVNQMRSTLTALTRVPGVGAMSDYETKLDQSKFPSRTAYESVTEDTLNNLDDQLSLIENGYRGLLGGGEPAEQTQAAPTAAKPSVSNW